jgi:CheY-like chemotaxis protein
MFAPNPEVDRPAVMIVDDVPDVRLGYRFILEAAGYEVVEASGGTEAIKSLLTYHVDLILTDLYMPGDIDGIGLVNAVQRMRRPIPAIIAMSGSPHLAYRSSLQAARYVGADMTLTKPITAELLISSVRRLIGGGPALLNQR